MYILLMWVELNSELPLYETEGEVYLEQAYAENSARVLSVHDSDGRIHPMEEYSTSM